MSSIHLVYPPVWPTEAPYLSLPALAAYLRNHTDAVVRVFDLNIAFWMQLRSEANLRHLWRWCREQAKRSMNPRSAAEVDIGVRFSSVAALGLSDFLQAVRTGQVPRDRIDSLVSLHFRAERHGDGGSYGLPLQGRGYYDPDTLPDVLSPAAAASSAERIAAALSSTGNRTAYVEIMPDLYTCAAGDERPDLLGISVTSANQVVPCFALADWIKRTSPRTIVIVGGAWVTHVLDRPDALGPLFGRVDAFVAGAGERPLEEILNRVGSGGSLEGIAGVFTRAGGPAGAVCDARWEAALDDLPTPDFAGLPLDAYDYPGLLPLQASRGCSWGRCTFCSYVTLDPRYRARAIDKVVSDIQTLAHRHDLYEVAFTDSLMEPNYFGALAGELIRRDVAVAWRGFGRFDRRFSREILRTMSRAGCHLVIWGMESASPRILKLMRKGNTPATIRANLHDAAEVGIHNRACLIYGFPGETRDDRDATISFIREHERWVHSLAFCEYTAVRDTPMTRSPQDYGLALEDETSPLALERKRADLPVDYLVETEQLLRGLCLQMERCAQTLGLGDDASRLLSARSGS